VEFRRTTPKAPALGFGAPDSDDTRDRVSANRAQNKMTIVESVASTKLNPGPSVPLKLSAGTASLDLTGQTDRQEDRRHCQCRGDQARRNPRVFALLRAGPSLTIRSAGSE